MAEYGREDGAALLPPTGQDGSPCRSGGGGIDANNQRVLHSRNPATARRQVRFKSIGQIFGTSATNLPQQTSITSAVEQRFSLEEDHRLSAKGRTRQLSWKIRRKFSAQPRRKKKHSAQRISETDSDSQDGSLSESPASQPDSNIPGREPKPATYAHNPSSSSSSGLFSTGALPMAKHSTLLPIESVPGGEESTRRCSPVGRTSTSSLRPSPVSSRTCERMGQISYPRSYTCMCGLCHVEQGARVFLILYVILTLGGLTFGLASAMVWALIPALVIPMTSYSLWRNEPKYLYPFLIITIIQMLVALMMAVILTLFSTFNFDSLVRIVEAQAHFSKETTSSWTLAIVILSVSLCLIFTLVFGWQTLVVSSCIHYYEKRAERSTKYSSRRSATANGKSLAQNPATCERVNQPAATPCEKSSEAQTLIAQFVKPAVHRARHAMEKFSAPRPNIEHVDGTVVLSPPHTTSILSQSNMTAMTMNNLCGDDMLGEESVVL